MRMQSCALFNWGKFTLKQALLIISVLYATTIFAKSAPAIYTAPLIFPKVEQLTDHLARVTAKLNSGLNPSKSYNIGIFGLGEDLLANCNPYPNFDACYFENITTASTISFLIIGDFTDGLLTDKHALLFVFSILPPIASGPGRRVVNFGGINYPKSSAATIQFFPFKKIISS